MVGRTAIIVCFLVITPVCIYGGWKFWKWYAMQPGWQGFLSAEAKRRTGGNLQLTNANDVPPQAVEEGQGGQAGQQNQQNQQAQQGGGNEAGQQGQQGQQQGQQQQGGS